jgi:Tfp pilus assembly protein PilF
MSDNRREKIYKSLIVKETEDLLDIWQNGEIDEWDAIVFEIIKEILLERLGYLPPQSIKFQISEILYRVEDYLEVNELEKALHECEIAINLNPDYAITYNCRGGIYAEMGQLENAMLNYQKAIELAPNFQDARKNMLSIESALEEEFKKSTAKQHLDLALEYANKNETNKALEECEMAKSTMPSIASAYNYLGLILDTLDLLEPAIHSYQKAIQLNPEINEAWENMLSVELGLEEEFEKSIAKQHLDQALEYANYDEFEKALVECEAANSAMPSIASAYNYRGLILQTANQIELAIDSYASAVKLNPRFYPARENLANARVTWEEEQYHLFSKLSPIEEQEVIEPDTAKIPESDEPLPQWLYMNEKSFLLMGYPGYRNRQGRSGYDPVERNAEQARMQGIMIHLLLNRKFRTRNPLYLILMVCAGILYFLIGVLPFFLGNMNGIIAGIIYSPYLIVGIMLLVNVYLSLRLVNSDEYEDGGYTFF